MSHCCSGRQLSSKAVIQREINMNRHLLILFSSLLFYCSEQETVGPDLLEFNISGKITSNYNPRGVEYAKVSLISGTITTPLLTNNLGEFSFSDLPKGIYKFEISNVDHKSFDTTITLKSDTTINILMQSNFWDYFPLKIGNTWTYTVNIVSGARLDSEDSFSGEESWDVKSIIYSSEETIYEMNLKRVGILKKLRTINVDGEPVRVITRDTINLSEDFEIIENINHELKIKHEYFSNYSDRLRFHPVNSDSIITYLIRGYIDFEKYQTGVGLIKRRYTFSSNAYVDQGEYELIKNN